MYTKVIINIILIFALVSIRLSFISALPGWFNSFNLILAIIIFILALGSLKLALWWAIGAGVLLDIFSFSPFGVFLISLCLAVVIVNFLLTNFFTNRSLYSFFALIIFFTLFYEFILNIVFYFLRLISSEAAFFMLNINFWKNLSTQIVLNLIAVLIIFYAINFASNRLKPAFLAKNKI
jgi:rod shape-determining protein MreD